MFFTDFIMVETLSEQVIKNEDFAALFDSIPAGIAIVDDSLQVKFSNKTFKSLFCREKNCPGQDQLGLYIDCMYGLRNKSGCGYSSECAACLLIKTIKNAINHSEVIQNVEMQLELRIDDKRVSPWFSINARGIEFEGARSVILVVDDISERKNIHDREALEVKSQFISTISHELRTPLTSLKNAINLILDRVAGRINGKQRHFLEIAQRNVDKLVMWINDVLDLQRLESSMMRLNMREGDINHSARDIYDGLVLMAEKKNVELCLKLEKENNIIRYDSDKINRILTNLVSNAIRFTPAGGKVTLSVSVEGKHLVLKVKDTGVGIPSDDMAHIFKMFYRVERKGKDVEGTGLGLPIVHKIVTMYGGKIEVDSEEGNGTQFAVTLPLNIESPNTISSVARSVTVAEDKSARDLYMDNNS